MAIPRAATCPPHHWALTRVRVDDRLCDHHRCLRCGAEKDLPAMAAASLHLDRPYNAEPLPVAED